jgi:hypothetical protein
MEITMGDLIELVKLPFRVLAFLVDSCLGLITMVMTIMVLICCLGWLVECGPTAAKVAETYIETVASSDSEETK